MSRILALLALPLLAACNVGVIPRDLPPPAPETTIREPEPDAPATEAPAAGPTEYRLDGHRLELPTPIAFQTGSDILDPASDPALEHVRGYLVAKVGVSTLRIEGHADDQALSERRALAVGRWLVAHGSECTRLLAVGFGPNKPIANAGSPEARAQNTRVELHNAALLGRPIGGMPLDGGGQVAGDLCQ